MLGQTNKMYNGEMAMDDGIRVMWNIPFLDIPITNVVVMSWIGMAVIIAWALISTRKLKLVPVGLQNTAEIVVESLTNFAEDIITMDGVSEHNNIYSFCLYVINKSHKNSQ